MLSEDNSQSNPNSIDNFQPLTRVESQPRPPQTIDLDEEDSANDDTTPKTNCTSSKRKRSVAWEHFDKVKVNGVDKASCKFCKKKLGCGSSNGTKHLLDHMYKYCPKRQRKGVDIGQQLLHASLNKDGKVNIGNYTFDQSKCRATLANMIIMHEYPLSIVEHVGFRRYSSELQPLFKMVSRNTIKSDILKIYDYEREKTLKLVEENKSRIAITTDMWTSGNQKRGFMVITSHFIDDSWQLQSRILRFAYVPCPHTKDVLCDVLMKTMLDWNVDRKLSTVTVDNCSSNDAMIEILLRKLTSSSLLLGGSLFHMRCCAHILNLIVKDGLDVIKEGIEKIRDSVVFWTATPKRGEKFEETARQLHIPNTKKLGLDCATRWNSTYMMLRTALIYKKVFSRLKQREPLYKNLPSETDWEFAKEICERLQIFYDTTELFSGTKFPTANLYFPKICGVRIALSKWLTCSNEVVREMTSNMVSKYDKYWSVIHGIMGVAAVLDPRYKMKLIRYYFPQLYGIESSIEVQKIEQLCNDLMEEYQYKLSLEKSGSEVLSSSSTCTQFNDSGQPDALSDYDLFVSNDERDTNETVKSELDNYLKEPVLPRTQQNFDILNWWNANGPKYPTLQAIARDILAIPISTVASESAFSTSGRLVSPHHSRLHPNTMEALMCAQNWLWAAEMQDNSTMESHGYATIYEDMDVGEPCCVDGEEMMDEA